MATMTGERAGLPRLRPADYLPVIPSEDVRRRFGIGVVGCGGIMRGAHLPIAEAAVRSSATGEAVALS
jgi:hypothetical protein